MGGDGSGFRERIDPFLLLLFCPKLFPGRATWWVHRLYQEQGGGGSWAVPLNLFSLF